MKSKGTFAELSDVSVKYRKKPALSNVNVSIPKGSICAIIGPNGAGKSTLIKALLDIVPLQNGTIMKDENTKISYIPQHEDIDWDFPATVFDIVMMGRYAGMGLFKKPTERDIQIVKSTIEKLGLTSLRNSSIRELSGGQKQRVFIARALAQEPDAFLLDEPFKGVDISTEKDLFSLFRELKQSGKTIIVVHHNLRNVAENFDWVVLMNSKVIAYGETGDAFTKDNIEEAYSN